VRCAEQSIVSAQSASQWNTLTSDIVQAISDHLDFKSQNSYAKSCRIYHNIIKIKDLPEPYLLTNTNIYNQAMIYYAQRNNADMVKYIYDNTLHNNRFQSQNTKYILIDSSGSKWSRVTIQDFIKIYSIQSDFNLYLNKFIEIRCPSIFTGIKINHDKAFYIIKLFLQQKMDINIKFNQGCSLLHLAASEHLANFMKELLIYSEINVNVKDDIGQTPLHYLAKAVPPELKHVYNTKPPVEMFKLLLAHPNIDLNVQDNDGDTILHLALLDKRTDLIDLLLRDSAIDLNIKNNKGNAPVHHKIFYKYIINKFPDKNFDINIKDEYGNTPLHYAKSYQIKSFLLKPNSQVNEPNNEGDTPFHYSIAHCEYSGGCGGCSSCLHRGKPKKCWREGYDLSKLTYLINHARIDINAQNNKGQSPLYYAIYYNRPELVKLLIDQLSITINIQDNEGNTPLHLAVKKSWYVNHILKLLLTRPEININIKNNDGYIPLDCAIKENKPDITKLLLACEGIEVPFFYKHRKIINLCSIAGTMSFVGLLTYFIVKNIYEK